MKKLLHSAVLLLALCTTGTESAESGPVALTRISLGDIGGWIEVPVETKGKMGHWLLDTGSTRNLVSNDFAKSLGLIGRSSVKADTALGQLQGSEVSLPVLRVGTLDLSGQTALMVDLRSVVGAAAEGIDGILGLPFFEGFEFELDLRLWTLELRKGVSATCPTGMSMLTLGQFRGLPVIDVIVNDGRAESLLLDTGNPAGVLRVEASAPSASAPGIALPGSASSRVTLARRVRIGEQLRLNVPVVQFEAPLLKRAFGSRITGLAGTALLDGARLRIDMVRRRACIESGSFSIPGGFGLTLTQREGALYAGTVLHGGPAQAAGIREGDAITSWAGAPPAGTLRDLWSRVQGLDEIELVISRDTLTKQLRRTYFAPPLP